tara:strand:+ start:390 stop:1496 length:1107 start_codon:yes stop_codon:yes gene_type:complete
MSSIRRQGPTAAQKLYGLAKRAGKPDFYKNIPSVHDFMCCICYDIPDSGEYALVGCAGAHTLCRNCIFSLTEVSPDKVKCPLCSQHVDFPTGVEAADKQRAFPLTRTPCCSHGCDYTAGLDELDELCVHIEAEHSDDFVVPCTVEGCPWHGPQCELGAHLEDTEAHAKLLAKYVLSTSAKVALLETELKAEREANTAFRAAVLQKLAAIGTSQDALSTTVSGVKRDLAAFGGQATGRVVKPMKRAPALGPDAGFPGGVTEKKMCARRRMRSWWGLEEVAENTGDWAIYREWVYEHYARSLAEGKELRDVRDDGAPTGWKKGDSTKGAPSEHYFDETRAKADRKIAEVMEYSRAVAAGEVVAQAAGDDD